MLGGFLRTFPSSCLCGPPEGALLGLTAVGDGLALALCRAYTAQKEALEFLSLLECSFQLTRQLEETMLGDIHLEVPFVTQMKVGAHAGGNYYNDVFYTPPMDRGGFYGYPY